MSRRLRGELLNECSTAWNLPRESESARRLEQILAIAMRRSFWEVAMVALGMLEVEYHDLGLPERVREKRATWERVEPLYLRWRASRASRARNSEKAAKARGHVANDRERFRPPPSRNRSRLNAALGRAIRLEPAYGRARELERLKKQAMADGCYWEAYLAARFKLAALSLMRGGDQALPAATRDAMRLGRRREVQCVLANDGNPIVEELRRWQEKARRTARTRKGTSG